MSFHIRALSCLLFLMAFIVPCGSQGAIPQPPERPGDYVVDLADVIKPDAEKEIAKLLRELEDKTSAQVAVLTFNSLEGEPIESFSISVVEKWKLGQKGKDNGILIAVAVNDRKYRFEVGYGLEGVLPDSSVGTIGRERLVPYFKKGDYSTGIYLASIDVARAVAASQGVVLEGAKASKRVSGKKASGVIAPIIVFVIIVILFSLRTIHGRGISGRGMSRREGPGGVIFWPDNHGGGFGRGGFGGGGGFGGFGGGGGGFGGGGASGGW